MLRSQDELRHFRAAVEAKKAAPAEASADMHQRWRFKESAGRIFHAVSTGRKNWANAGKSNLSAMRVARQHEIEIVLLRPRNLLWTVRKQYSKWLVPVNLRWAFCHVGRSWEPRQLVSAKQNRLIVDRNGFPATT